MRYSKPRGSRWARAAALCGSVWLLAACGRTGLLEASLTDDSNAPGIDAGVDAAIDAAVPPVPDAAAPAPDGSTGPAPCQPTAEICNGVDDDCNGEVDDLAPIPCPGGGSRYCVAGRLSACPERCDVCLPGSERVCFLSYCLYWGTQACAADGKSFGPCREDKPPAECDAVARDHKDSPELEQCCVDNGYCCADTHDLDADGNRSEFLGRCDEVTCHP